MMATHTPVMKEAVVNMLVTDPNGVYIDCTFGRGGHTSALLEKLGEDGRVIAIDKDPEAIAYGRIAFAKESRVLLQQCDFSDIYQTANHYRLLTRVIGVMADLGVSSPQFDDPARGFSFSADGPLDMRMNPEQGTSVADWLATASEQAIAEILWQYGQERYARRIAKAIIQQRAQQDFRTTLQLAGLIAKVVPKSIHKHPATRTFQALRIFVNDELQQLKCLLAVLVKLLQKGGRAVVMSFHSLEDALVKHFFRSLVKPPVVLPKEIPLPPQSAMSHWHLLGKQRCSASEVSNNRRARSAILRGIERLV